MIEYCNDELNYVDINGESTVSEEPSLG